MADIKIAYNKLKEQYSLPEYDYLNRKFHISDIESDELLLARIRLKIQEQLESYAKMAEATLQPESGLNSMYEAHYLNDQDKNRLYSTFKKLMHLVRLSNLAGLENTDDVNASYIRSTVDGWKHLEAEILPYLKKLSEVWKKETDIKNDLSYFG